MSRNQYSKPKKIKIPDLYIGTKRGFYKGAAAKRQK